eukprot:gene25863-biopygen10940
MKSCHEEGVRDLNRAGIEAADPARHEIGSFDSSSIPVANTFLTNSPKPFRMMVMPLLTRLTRQETMPVCGYEHCNCHGVMGRGDVMGK